MKIIDRILKALREQPAPAGKTLKREYGRCADLHFELGYMPPEAVLGVCAGSVFGDHHD